MEGDKGRKGVVVVVVDWETGFVFAIMVEEDEGDEGTRGIEALALVLL